MLGTNWLDSKDGQELWESLLISFLRVSFRGDVGLFSYVSPIN